MSTGVQRSVLDGSGYPLDQIQLRGIEARGFHGVLDSEREAGQDFSADVTLHLDTRAAAHGDDLAETVNYALVAQDVVEILSGAPVNLIETVAEQIAAAVLLRPQVVSVDVTVHKPQAPIPVPFGDVVVVIQRDRLNPPVVPSPLGSAAAEEPHAEVVPEPLATGLEIVPSREDALGLLDVPVPGFPLPAFAPAIDLPTPAVDAFGLPLPVDEPTMVDAPGGSGSDGEALGTRADEPDAIDTPAEFRMDDVDRDVAEESAAPAAEAWSGPELDDEVAEARPVSSDLPEAPAEWSEEDALGSLPTDDYPEPAGPTAPEEDALGALPSDTYPELVVPATVEDEVLDAGRDPFAADVLAHGPFGAAVLAENLGGDALDAVDPLPTEGRVDAAPDDPTEDLPGESLDGTGEVEGIEVVDEPADDLVPEESASSAEELPAPPARRPALLTPVELLSTRELAIDPEEVRRRSRTPEIPPVDEELLAEQARLSEQARRPEIFGLRPAAEVSTMVDQPAALGAEAVPGDEAPDPDDGSSTSAAVHPSDLAGAAFFAAATAAALDRAGHPEPSAPPAPPVDDFPADGYPMAEPTEEPAPEDEVLDASEDVEETSLLAVTFDRMDSRPAAPVEAVLALGANLGDAQSTLRAAVAELGGTDGIDIVGVGPLARTAAVGGPDQPDFLNTVLLVATSLSARELMLACQSVEAAHGRERDVHWGPRTLDIDVIVYQDVVATAPDLDLPHPRANERAFVLAPWAHLQPDAELPGLGGGPVAVLAATAPDRDGIRWLALDWLQDSEAPAPVDAGAPAVPVAPAPAAPAAIPPSIPTAQSTTPPAFAPGGGAGAQGRPEELAQEVTEVPGSAGPLWPPIHPQ